MSHAKLTISFSLGLVLAGAGVSVRVVAQYQQQQQQQQQQQTQSADRLLSLGNFYLKNNDTTDEADRYYKQVISRYYPARQAGVAQFNRGSYWHGKFNILRETKGDKDKVALSALVEAERQYYAFIDKFAANTGTTDLLADAEFNLALVYLQSDRRDVAEGWLNVLLSDKAPHGAKNRDDQIRIYRIVWSSKSTDIIDRSYNSAELAQFALSVFTRNDLTPDQIISQLRQWCRKR